MATQLFEGKEHASYYQKYRLAPPPEIQDLIFNYLQERLDKPYKFAVDVGCGTGQSTRILAPHFEKILATDISEAQIEEAKKANTFPNITFSASPAEEVPVDDASVDLLTASAAVHWFEIGKFLKEVDRVLKNRGCLAFFSYLPHMEIHYKDRSEQMNKIVSEVEDVMSKYQHEKVYHVKTGYKDIFEAIPYTDKIRRDDITIKVPMPLSEYIGLIKTFSMFQSYHRLEPEKAMDFIKTTEQRHGHVDSVFNQGEEMKEDSQLTAVLQQQMISIVESTRACRACICCSPVTDRGCTCCTSTTLLLLLHIDSVLLIRILLK